MSAGSYCYPNNYDLYAGYTLMPKGTTPAPIGSLPLVSTTPGIAQWVPASTALTVFIPDDVEYYISTTGSDVTGDGSAGNPFATITKGVATVVASGYNNTAQLVIMDDMSMPLGVMDTSTGGLGSQAHPLSITGISQTTVSSGTVNTMSVDVVTGLFSLISNEILFGIADVGRMIQFTSGALSIYQETPASAPTPALMLITRVLGPSQVELAFTSSTTPTPGDTFNVVENDVELTFTNNNLEDNLTFKFDRVHFNNINFSFVNTIAGDLNVRFEGLQVYFSGVHAQVLNGALNTDFGTNFDTTYNLYSTGPLNNNTAGVWLDGTGFWNLDNPAESTSVTFTNSGFGGGGGQFIGSWSIVSSRSVGTWNFNCIIAGRCVQSNFDFNSSVNSVAAVSGILSIESSSFQNSISSGLQALGGQILLQSGELYNNTIQINANLGGIVTMLNPTAVILTPGISCKQVFRLSNNSQLIVQGGLVCSTTVAGGAGEAAISLLNGSDIFVSSSLTVTSAGVGFFAEGFSRSQFGDCGITSSSTAMQLVTGSEVDCGIIVTSSTTGVGLVMNNSELRCTSCGITALAAGACTLDNTASLITSADAVFTSTISGTAVTLNRNCNLTVGTTLTANGKRAGIVIQRASTAFANSITASNNDATYHTIYVANESFLGTDGITTLSGTSDTAITLTYGGKVGLTDVTISNTCNYGIYCNLHSVFNCFGVTITTSTLSSIFLSRTRMVANGNITANSSGTAVRLDNLADLSAGTLTVTSANIGLSVVNSVAILSNLAISGVVTGVEADHGKIFTNLASTITGSGDSAVTLNYTSAWESSDTVTITGTSIAGLTMDNVSTFNTTNLSVSGVDTTCTISSSNITASGTITVSASAGEALSTIASIIQAVGNITVTQTIQSHMTGGTLKSGGALSVTSSAGTCLNCVGVEITGGSSMTISQTSNGFSLFDGCGFTTNGPFILTAYTIMTSCRLFCGDIMTVSPAASATGGLSLNGSTVQLGGTLTVNGATTTTPLTIQDSTFSSSGNIATTGSTNTGINVISSVVSILGSITCTSATTGLTSVRSRITCSSITCNDTTSQGVVITNSDLNCTSISATSTTGVLATQINISGSNVACQSMLATRSVLGTAHNSIISIARSTVSVSGAVQVGNNNAIGLLIDNSIVTIDGGYTSTIGGNNSPHAQISNSKLSVFGGNITGGGTGIDGYRILAGSTVTLTNVNVNNPGGGSGVKASGSLVNIINSTLSNCPTGGLWVTKDCNGTLETVVGTGNGTYGVRLDATSRFSTNSLCTVTGTTADVLIGSSGTKTWVQVNGGNTGNVCDYGGASTKIVAIVPA